MKHFHSRLDDTGQLVELKAPHQPTALSNWDDVTQIATVVPGGAVPADLNGIGLQSWTTPPTAEAGWEKQGGAAPFTEPPMEKVSGKAVASGVVITEVDGRVWVVSPSNRFGGYVNTFPKGKLESGLSLRANAVKEAFEESGLLVELTGFLCDSLRSTTVTRYYAARRLAGNPADAGWETQAVHLVPLTLLPILVTHPNDEVILQALKVHPN